MGLDKESDMTFGEVIATDEWRCVYNRVLELWKWHYREAVQAKTFISHQRHSACITLLEDLMAMPMSDLVDSDKEKADSYRKKLVKTRNEFHEMLRTTTRVTRVTTSS
jgi:hypothetical protein